MIWPKVKRVLVIWPKIKRYYDKSASKCYEQKQKQKAWTNHKLGSNLSSWRVKSV